MDLIIYYILVIASVAALPHIIDIFLSYCYTYKIQKKLITEASFDKLDETELKEFLKIAGKAPSGIPGLSRAMMALTVIVILGIAVVHVLVEGSTTDDNQIINNILSMLAGLLAAITGFYFGGKTTDKKNTENQDILAQIAKKLSDSEKPNNTR